jgi:hypothetical protein
VVLADVPAEATLVLACDDRFKLSVNGRAVATGADHKRPELADLRPHLVRGDNVVAIEAVNDAAGGANPAGLIAHLRLRGPGLDRADVVSDAGWRWAVAPGPDWTSVTFDDRDWAPAAVLGPPDTAPWQLREPWAAALAAASRFGHVRAALVASDPLMVALGRPNREQVVTRRPTAATTLEALELTNGATLAARLQRGAARLLRDLPGPAPALATEVYRRALGRVPTDGELRLAEELMGSPPAAAGVEDVLWALTMLPEFQLIH